MKKFNILFIILALFSASSCSNWLDITPKGQVEDKQLLSNVRGYNSALAGIYNTLTQTSMYGQQLTFGAMDVMAQYWDFRSSSSHSYNKFANYNYADLSARTTINDIWGNYYQCIAMSNKIIESLENSRDSVGYSYLFKAEAYALRGFLHFEVLGLFGPVIKSSADLEKPAIPYRNKFNVEQVKFGTVKQTIASIKADLNIALKLFNNDPIKVMGRTGNLNSSLLDYNNVLDRRGSRINYFAVRALLCRLELYEGNKDEAYILASSIIEECKTTLIGTTPVFRFTPTDIFNSTQSVNRDIISSSEMLFSLYINDLYDIAGPVFNFVGYTANGTNTSIRINQTQYANIVNYLYGRSPDGAGTDFRLKYWFVVNPNTSSYFDFNKLKKPTIGGGMYPPSYPEIAIIKLAEIYYIACECMIGRDNDKSIAILNEVRVSRGLPELGKGASTEQMNMYLTREMRKEFIGEGRMFHYYKRRFLPIEEKNAVTISPQISNFVFPIPDDEYEFSNNPKP